MESYTSDSSDSDAACSTLDFNNMALELETIEDNLEAYSEGQHKPAKDIETILLRYNQLGTLPEHLCKFTNLQKLDVTSTGLTTLHDIFQHCQLTTLIAKNNFLTNDSLPKTFQVNSSLKELNLSGNRLTSFPEQVFDFVKLKYLYLGGNRISNISRNIWKLSNLRTLSMGGNELSDVPITVGQLTMLTVLILCDNHLESLPASIANLHKLKSLLLHKNRLRTLPPEIIALKNLTELSLRDNPLVVRFVSDMTYNPSSLLELTARTVLVNNIEVNTGDVPETLYTYLTSGHRCVNPKCKGVYFDNRVEHIKFVDFCGKYRIPLLQYLCSSKCITGNQPEVVRPGSSYMMRKVLLG